MDVFDERLEAQIARDPEDRAAFAVYADWLQQAGSVRGELAAVQLAREAADTPALAAREDALLATHADVFSGEKQADGYRIPDHCSEILYRGGFWKAVRFSGPLRVLAALAAHPSARLLQRLAVDYTDTADDYRAAVAVIVAHHWPALRELRLGDMPEGQSALAGFGDRAAGSLAGLAAACPRLEVVRLLCPSFEIGDQPNLRVIDARLGATPDAIARLAQATLPALTTIELGYDNTATEDEVMYPSIRWSETVLDPLLDRLPPQLALLRLWPLGEGGELAAELAARGRGRVEIASLDDLESDDTHGAYTL